MKHRAAWAVVGIAITCTLGSTACRRCSQVIVVAAVDPGSDWLIWDLDPAVGWEKCELHGTRLTTVVVPILHGYAPPEIFDRRFLAAEGEQFPHAEDSEEGGCLPLEYTHARVKHCSTCAEAKERWLSAHPAVAASGRPPPTDR